MDHKMNFKNRIIGSGVEKAGQLLVNSYNFRIHGELQQKGVKGSLDEIGWIQQVIVNKQTGRIIDGHLLVKLALREGEETEVPVVYVDLSENEEKLALSLIDPLAEMAVMDKEIYKELLDELNTTSADLQATLDEIAKQNKIDFGLGETQDAEPQIDQAEELNKIWKVKTGDLWRIGDHRLLCGDSTKREDVERVMGGEKAILMVTDPPYGVEYDADWRNRADRANGKPYGARAIGVVTNDERVDWTDAYSLLIWVKSNIVISRGDYHYRHEPCWYAVRKGKNHNWQGSRKESSVWEIDKPMKSETGHSTQKPIECMAKPIENNTAIGEFVYDPFAGSGTTMVACQNLNRKCRGIEISKNYCAVILQRMKDAFPGIDISKQ